MKGSAMPPAESQVAGHESLLHTCNGKILRLRARHKRFFLTAVRKQNAQFVKDLRYGNVGRNDCYMSNLHLHFVHNNSSGGNHWPISCNSLLACVVHLIEKSDTSDAKLKV